MRFKYVGVLVVILMGLPFVRAEYINQSVMIDTFIYQDGTATDYGTNNYVGVGFFYDDGGGITTADIDDRAGFLMFNLSDSNILDKLNRSSLYNATLYFYAHGKTAGMADFWTRVYYLKGNWSHGNGADGWYEGYNTEGVSNCYNYNNVLCYLNRPYNNSVAIFDTDNNADQNFSEDFIYKGDFLTTKGDFVITKWHEINLTNTIREVLGNDENNFSLMLINYNASTNQEQYFNMRSSEYGADNFGAYLYIETWMPPLMKDVKYKVRREDVRGSDVFNFTSGDYGGVVSDNNNSILFFCNGSFFDDATTDFNYSYKVYKNDVVDVSGVKVVGVGGESLAYIYEDFGYGDEVVFECSACNRDVCSDGLNSSVVSVVSPYFNITSLEYNNVSRGDTVYVGSNVTVNYSCVSGYSAYMLFSAGGSVMSNRSLSCGVSGNYSVVLDVGDLRGNYSVGVFVDVVFDSLMDNWFGNDSYYFDLQPPEAFVVVTSAGGGFGGIGNSLVNVSYYCVDSDSLYTNYTVDLNTVRLLGESEYAVNSSFYNLTSGTGLDNDYVYVFCEDFFRSDALNESFTVYSKTLNLINETAGDAFNVANLTSIKVYVADNSSFYDFTANGVSSVNYTSVNYTKLRFELVYKNGDVITRYIDTSLFSGSDEIDVCANLEGTVHYEQLLLSSVQRPVWVYNRYSNCYVAADYTRFAYQDSYVLKAYTIAAQYNVFVNSGGSKVILAGLDGSIASYVNLDILEYSLTDVDYSILSDSLVFEPLTGSIMKIVYKNLEGDNSGVVVRITRTDNDTVVYSGVELDSPNNFSILFSWGGLVNVTNSTLFKIDLDMNKTGGTTDSLSRYFNLNARVGFLSSGLSAILAIFLLVFGFTLASSKVTFSWFGIFVCLSALVLLSLAVNAWYILLLEVVTVIMAIYCVIIMIQQNVNTVS